MMKNYKIIKICLFDFDGTLVDTMGQFADLAGSIIEKEYHTPFEKARRLYLESSGIPFFQQLDLLFPNRARNNILANEFESRKQESFFSEQFSGDVVEAMNRLKTKGYKIGISSNNFQELVEQFVERETVSFDYVLGFKEGFAKGKEHFQFIEKSAHCSSNELLFVGDSLKDAEKAMENNIQFIGKIGTFSKNQFHHFFPEIDTIENLKELIEILP